ncbi:hypothetical protein [Nostoc favosum]|nr:hypothetical protein [Nostoc favosum]
MVKKRRSSATSLQGFWITHIFCSCPEMRSQSMRSLWPIADF